MDAKSEDAIFYLTCEPVVVGTVPSRILGTESPPPSCAYRLLLLQKRPLASHSWCSTVVDCNLIEVL
jgi:hypothetical protein